MTEERRDLAMGHFSLKKARSVSKIARNRMTSLKNSTKDLFDQNQAETIK